MTNVINEFLQESIEIRQRMLADEALLSAITDCGNEILKRTSQGGCVYICGNGGSACDAAHFAEELVARYKRERQGIKAMHFGDPGVLTCWSNDYDYQSTFKRQAETFCSDKDVLVGISTSGNSGNVLQAIEAAKSKGSFTIGLLGKDGGKIKDACDSALIVPSSETDRIQEVHITIIHTFCEMLEV